MRKFFGIILILNFLSFQGWAQNYRETSFDNRPICEKDKGVWRGFGNGCAGGCQAKLDPFMICTQTVTYGCDCGINRCWDGKSCINLSDYKKEYDAAKEKEDLVLAKAKKDRQAAYKQYQQSLLDKLSGQVASAAASASSSTQDFFGSMKDKVGQITTSDNQQVQTQPGGSIITQIPSPDQSQKQANSVPENVEIPPFFLEKQKQDAAKKQQLGMDNLEAQALSAMMNSGKDNSAAVTIPGLPEIPLP